MSNWTQLGLAIGNRVHLAPKKKIIQKPKKSKSTPLKKKPPIINYIDLNDLNDSLDDLYVRPNG